MADIEETTYIVSDFDFSLDTECKQFGCQQRIVDISRCGDVISLSFSLSNKEGSCLTMMLNLNELLICLGRLKI